MPFIVFRLIVGFQTSTSNVIDSIISSLFRPPLIKPPLVQPSLFRPFLSRLGAAEEGLLRGDRGQATTEYALVLLAAALVGLLVVAWATAGGGAERVGRLFNRVLDSAIERV